MQRSAIRERPSGRSSYSNIQWGVMIPGFRYAASGLRWLREGVFAQSLSTVRLGCTLGLLASTRLPCPVGCLAHGVPASGTR